MKIGLYRYIVYRLSRLRISFGSSRKNAYTLSFLNTRTFFAFNLLTIILFVISTINVTLSLRSLIFLFVMITALLVIMDINNFDSDDEQLYEILDSEYNNDNHSLFKGLLVVLYFILTIVFLIIGIIIII